MHNKLLERQLKRYLRNTKVIPAEFQELLVAISHSYDHYESNRLLIERSLEISSAELTEANEKVLIAYRQIEEKNRNILDSISYAKRIQEALLPARDHFGEHFSNAFIFYRPKDIVSGDFYWYDRREGKRIIALVDCTGHGVPGALMSIVGNKLLDEIVNGEGATLPSEILTRLNAKVVNSLRQSENEDALQTRDGMDIALCTIDDEKKELVFSSANRKLIRINRGEMTEIKGDKFPIGGFHGQKKIFTDHLLSHDKDDCFYLFSDGFADQFGGPYNKKYMMRQLKDLLLSIYNLPMSGQEAEISKALDGWKGELEQADDICVIGFKP